MPKTNFTKVESLVEEGIEQRKIDAIVDQTRTSEESRTESNPKLFLVESIRYDVHEIPLYDQDFFKTLGLRKKEILDLIRNPSSLTDKDWQLVKEIHQKISDRKEEIQDDIPKPTDEDIIEFEKRRHIYKRFNVNDRWLPLH